MFSLECLRLNLIYSILHVNPHPWIILLLCISFRQHRILQSCEADMAKCMPSVSSFFMFLLHQFSHTFYSHSWASILIWLAYCYYVIEACPLFIARLALSGLFVKEINFSQNCRKSVYKQKTWLINNSMRGNIINSSCSVKQRERAAFVSDKVNVCVDEKRNKHVQLHVSLTAHLYC